MSPLSWEKKPRQESRAALSLPRGCRARCLSQPRFVTALSLPLRCPLHPAFSFQHARSRVKIKGRQRGRNAISAPRSFQPEVHASLTEERAAWEGKQAL